MKISVAGEDRTDRIAGGLEKLSEERKVDPSLAGGGDSSLVLDLAESGSESEFAEKHIKVLRHSCYVDNADLDLPSGSMVRMLRKLSWNILRPVFDWMSHKQNNINAQVVQSLEMEKKIRDREIKMLRDEIDDLKKHASN